MYSLLITDLALLQTQEAYQYYESIRFGLGEDFFRKFTEEIFYFITESGFILFFR